MSDKIDIEKLLQSGQSVMIEPIGTSMYPLFVDRHDKAVIVPIDSYYRKLRRGDVCVYRRDNNGKLIIHRIVKKASKGVFFAGDHQTEIEGPIPYNQIIGIMVSFVRLGKECSAQNPIYLLLSSVWLMLRPCRSRIIKLGSLLKKLFFNRNNSRA